MSIVNSVRNKQGIWINSNAFREEAAHFKKYKYYTPDPWGSPAWADYWKEQYRRCKEGYSSGGVSITGNHYFYLNFAQIQVAKKVNNKVAKKVTTFPDFWDGDYNYFWALELARFGIDNVELCFKEQTENKFQQEFSIDFKSNQEHLLKYYAELYRQLNLEVKVKPKFLTGGYHMIVGKSRRKGYSYKNAAILANAYNTVRNSINIVGAYEKKFLYPNGTMGMASNYLNFLNKHTGWRKSRDFIDRQDHKRASFKEVIDGIGTEQGYMSEIMALSFKDNPDAARGKDAYIVELEESGAFGTPGLLKNSYLAIEPALRAGSYITGQIIVFGTGGDMEAGTVDYAEMFYSPEAFNLMPFENIWDEGSEGTHCGFFHPVYWNMEGFYDEQGNSDYLGAIEFEKKQRQKILKSSATGGALLQKHVQEYPTKPEEAFLIVSTNEFPIELLRKQLNKVEKEKLQLKKGQPVTLEYETKEIETFRGKEKKKIVRAKPDLQEKLQPVIHYRPKTQDRTSCVIIYEHPPKDVPFGKYKIGYDPHLHDEEGDSMSAIFVKKDTTFFETEFSDQIVAEYVGRPSSKEEVDEIALKLSILYNTEVMYENMVPHTKNYFRRKGKLSRLAAQPDRVISKNIKQSKVARVFGCHMNDKLKEAGEVYIKKWLLKEKGLDENNDLITTIDTIYSVGLLEELIQYNKKGNFDRVMALMMAMFQEEEEAEINLENEKKAQDFISELDSIELFEKGSFEHSPGLDNFDLF